MLMTPVTPFSLYLKGNRYIYCMCSDRLKKVVSRVLGVIRV